MPALMVHMGPIYKLLNRMGGVSQRASLTQVGAIMDRLHGS